MLALRNARVASVLALLVFINQGCNKSSNHSEAGPTKSSILDISSKVDEWVWDAALFARNKSIQELRKLAPVVRESTTKRVDQGQEGKHTVSIHSIYFDGLVIRGIMDGEKFILDEIEITSPRWQVPNGLNVGSRGNLVPPVFGLPARELVSPKELFSGLACSVQFTSDAGRISKVSYAFFYD